MGILMRIIVVVAIQCCLADQALAKPLVVGGDRDYPPYEFIDKCNCSGQSDHRERLHALTGTVLVNNQYGGKQTGHPACWVA